MAAVLSGNRNFEGRINPDVKMNYLASPPLVVAYALAGSMDVDLTREPLGTGPGRPRRVPRRLWPSAAESRRSSGRRWPRRCSPAATRTSSPATSAGTSLPVPTGTSFGWDSESTYVRKPPYFEGMTVEPEPVADITGARVLAKLGDSVTTDHISPAGASRPTARPAAT